MDALRPQGDYITKEQFRKEAHISKRKALALIQSGLVPAIDTHRKTRRYWIKREDMLHYIQEREGYPNKYGRKIPPKVLCQGVYVEHDCRTAVKLRRSITSMWNEVPDMLSICTISQLLGYDADTVRRWIKKCDVARIRTEYGTLISKKSLILMLTGKEIQTMKYKSQKHFELLRRALYE